MRPYSAPLLGATVRVSLVGILLVAHSLRADEFQSVLQSFGNLSTVAGTAFVDGAGVNGWHASMEAGPAVSAELSRPHMTMADREGNLFIADKDAHAVRLVTRFGTIHTIAGTNVAGYNGDGDAASRQLNEPNGLYTFPDGTTYILDLANSRIRRWSGGTLTTVVQDPLGISLGRGLWVSADESLIYYASGNNIRKWSASEGLSTLASGFVGLGNLTVDPMDGTVVATDRDGHSVYKVLPDGSAFRIAGNGSTFGGGDGSFATDTGLNEVRGVYHDTTGGYYLATHRDSDIWYVDTQGIIHLMIEGDRDNDTHGGDGQPLTTPGLKISEPRSVTLSPNRDLLITENDGGFIRHVPRAVNVLGDFDYDGQVTAADADLLSRVVQVGVNPMTFNLNESESRFVDREDLRILVEELAGSHMGDANLDGAVDALDLALWADNRFLVSTTWSTGDFNADGRTDGLDFNIWNANKTRNSAPLASVPEPHAAVLLLLTLACLVVWRRS